MEFWQSRSGAFKGSSPLCQHFLVPAAPSEWSYHASTAFHTPAEMRNTMWPLENKAAWSRFSTKIYLFYRDLLFKYSKHTFEAWTSKQEDNIFYLCTCVGISLPMLGAYMLNWVSTWKSLKPYLGVLAWKSEYTGHSFYMALLGTLFLSLIEFGIDRWKTRSYFVLLHFLIVTLVGL